MAKKQGTNEKNKSRIRETLNLSTDADSSTNTIFFLLADHLVDRVGDVEEEGEGEGQAVEAGLPGVGVQLGEEAREAEQHHVEEERQQDPRPDGQALAVQHVQQEEEEVGRHGHRGDVRPPEGLHGRQLGLAPLVLVQARVAELVLPVVV